MRVVHADMLVAGRQYGLSASQRREQELRTEVSLLRPITDRVVLEARWTWNRNRSTASVFDYTRNIVGAYVTFGFGRSS